MKNQLILSCFLGCFVYANAQLTLTEKPAAELIQNLAANETNAIISNVYFNGAPNSMKEFSGYVYNMPFWEGILITTGNTLYALGPNDESGAGIDNGYIGYGPLDNTYGDETFNAAYFDFDIKPLGDTITLEYIFASEEFNVPTYGNDAFAILISGPGITGVKNIARLPNNQLVCRNSFTDMSYYISNGNGGPPYNESDLFLEYNGISVPLTAKQAVIPNQTYHITLVVMDVLDATFDTGVFIHYRSLTAGIPENTLAETVSISYNPLAEEASIEIKGDLPNLECSLIDLSGKNISGQVLSGSGKIDLKGLPAGMYLVHLKGPDGELTKQIVKY